MTRSTDRLSDAILTGDPSAWWPRLLSLMEEQHAACERLDALSQPHAHALGGDDCDGLLRVVGERQVLVDRVCELDRELGVFLSVRERAMQRLSAPQREVVVQRLGAIAAAVGRVRERDQAHMGELERERARVLDELSGLSRSRSALAAYAAEASGTPAIGAGGGAVGLGDVPPRFQDRRA